MAALDARAGGDPARLIRDLAALPPAPTRRAQVAPHARGPALPARACRALFERGAYLPLAPSGARQRHVIAFARLHQPEARRRHDSGGAGRRRPSCVGRFFAALSPARVGRRSGRDIWGDSVVRAG